MDDLPPEVFQRAERQVNAVLAKIIGGVLLWIGVAFLGLFVWALHKVVIIGRPLDTFAFVMLGVFAVLATFCALVGWRLFLNRPNRFGSILGPFGWRVLGTMFGVMAAAAFVHSVVLLRNGESSEGVLVTAVTTLVSCAIFCHWCFLAARRAVSNARR
jgi:hypothetical protein